VEEGTKIGHIVDLLHSKLDLNRCRYVEFIMENSADHFLIIINNLAMKVVLSADNSFMLHYSEER
jgi:hypothetical protein